MSVSASVGYAARMVLFAPGDITLRWESVLSSTAVLTKCKSRQYDRSEVAGKKK